MVILLPEMKACDVNRATTVLLCATTMFRVLLLLTNVESTFPRLAISVLSTLPDSQIPSRTVAIAHSESLCAY